MRRAVAFRFSVTVIVPARFVFPNEDESMDLDAERERILKNGGPAFPTTFTVDGSVVVQEGLTVRDYFAIRCKPMFDGTGDPDSRARAAYREADAMLAARRENQP